MPTSYPDPSRRKPYDCIFIKEHIQSVAPYCESRILFMPNDQPRGSRLTEMNRTVKDGVLTDRIYFKTIRPLWITNVYVRFMLLFYFLKMMIVERFYPDIIHVHFHQAGLIAILFCKLFRIKMVVTEHWSAFIGWPELPELRFKKATEVFKHAKWVFTVSRKIRDGVEERCGINLKGKTSITLNSVDTNLFYHDPSLTPTGDHIRRILCVARLAEEKDLPVLFEALHILGKSKSNFQCEIIGTGDPQQYSNKLDELGQKEYVIFVGPKPKHEIAKKMQAADILAISSFIENSPCVIGEALCTGLPVVSTNVGGIPELVDETNGMLVPPKNPEKLAEALYKALYEKQFDRTAISQKAQAHFSFQAIGQQLFSIYQKVLS